MKRTTDRLATKIRMVLGAHYVVPKKSIIEYISSEKVILSVLH
jgi:hypothetical protein